MRSIKETILVLAACLLIVSGMLLLFAPKALAAEQAPDLPSYEELIWEDGGAYFAWAATIQEAEDMVDEYAANHMEGREYGPRVSGQYEPEVEYEWVVDQEYQPAWSEIETHEAGLRKFEQDSYCFTVPAKSVIGIKQANDTVAFWSAYEWDEQGKADALATWKSHDKTSTCEHVIYWSGFGAADLSQTEGKNLGTYTMDFDGGAYVTFSCDPGKVSHAWAWWDEWQTGVYHPEVLECGHYEKHETEGAYWANTFWTNVAAEPEPEPEPEADEPEPTVTEEEYEEAKAAVEEASDEAADEFAEEATWEACEEEPEFYLPKTGDEENKGILTCLAAVATIAAIGILYRFKE